jgi:hypothetical protein
MLKVFYFDFFLSKINNATSYANGTGYVKDLSKPNRLGVQFGRGPAGNYDVYDTGKDNLKLNNFF